MHIIAPTNDLDREIDRPLGKHIQASVVNFLACGLLYFLSYTSWKIGFVASLETSLRHVFWVKTS
jgi:hypothetical protein